MKSTVNQNTNWHEGVVLLFDKPLYWTSFNLVSKVKVLLKQHLGLKKIKVGHAGTLDPLASGLLVVCIGKATKKISEFQDHEKEYLATIRLGATTPSFDLETEINAEYPIDHITPNLIDEALKKFTGFIMQVPPLYSAKFVDGKRAYDLARKGVEMELTAVPVEILNISMESYNAPMLTVRIRCSKGTYVRSLARDIGRALNSGGHLVALRRTASGALKAEDAYSIEEFELMLRNTFSTPNEYSAKNISN
jgi:tRNA pseudouridine55 synthase